MFNGGVWLFKLNYQALTPSSPHQPCMQKPQNLSLVSLHCSPLKHPRPFLSPSLSLLPPPGRCHPCGACTGCTQRHFCISAVALLVLVAAVASGVAALALLPRAPGCIPRVVVFSVREAEMVLHEHSSTSFAQPRWPPAIPWLCPAS